MPMNSPATALTFDLATLSAAEFACEIDQLRQRRALQIAELYAKKRKKAAAQPRKPRKPKAAKAETAPKVRKPRKKRSVTLEELTKLGLKITPEQLAAVTKG